MFFQRCLLIYFIILPVFNYQCLLFLVEITRLRQERTVLEKAENDLRRLKLANGATTIPGAPKLSKNQKKKLKKKEKQRAEKYAHIYKPRFKLKIAIFFSSFLINSDKQGHASCGSRGCRAKYAILDQLRREYRR